MARPAGLPGAGSLPAQLFRPHDACRVDIDAPFDPPWQSVQQPHTVIAASLPVVNRDRSRKSQKSKAPAMPAASAKWAALQRPRNLP